MFQGSHVFEVLLGNRSVGVHAAPAFHSTGCDVSGESREVILVFKPPCSVIHYGLTRLAHVNGLCFVSEVVPEPVTAPATARKVKAALTRAKARLL